MNYKLTIDVNLMHTEPKIAAMDTLKRWKTEGKIELIEAEPPRQQAYGWPGAPPRPVERSDGRPRGRPKKEPGALEFKGVAAVLFPQKDPQKLNMREINDVAHLIKHHSSHNELFITANTQDFIANGKRERLKAVFGIIALTADEAITMLKELEGWK